MQLLSEFIQRERSYYEEGDNNRFAISFGQVLSYYEFIQIILVRHEAESRQMLAKQREIMASRPLGGEGLMTNEEMIELHHLTVFSTLVHLEIESFYLFAKIMLDKLALFLQNYFGQAKNVSLRSHDQFTKNQEEYRVSKNLVYPSGFVESLVFLKDHGGGRVCQDRGTALIKVPSPPLC